MILNDVVATVSTKSRTNTTLPLVLTSLLCSTYKPSKLVIYDDNDAFKDPRENEVLKNVLQGLILAGINWYWNPGQRKGQIHNHEHARLNYDSEFIWRIDDDNILPANVLENLYDEIQSDPKIGAVGPSILDPKNKTYSSLASNNMMDIDLGLNIQWNHYDKITPIEVEHLQGSTFLYRRAAATHGYNLKLSRVAHREETLFTYEMFRNGWKLIALCGLNTWHMRYGSGGIRDHNIKHLFDSDEQIFRNKLNEWNVTPYLYKVVYLDSGRGDHYAFKPVLEELSQKYKGHKIIVGACYPDIFWDVSYPNAVVTTMSEVAGFLKPDDHNIYKFMAERRWKDSLTNAYRKMYL